MKTLNQFISGLETIPATTSWYLADISESKGKQDSGKCARREIFTSHL